MALVLMDCVVQDNNFAREAFRRLYLTERFVLFDLHRCSLQIDGEMSMKKVLGYFRLLMLRLSLVPGCPNFGRGCISDNSKGFVIILDVTS
jgi:hypothetical protein